MLGVSRLTRSSIPKDACCRERSLWCRAYLSVEIERIVDPKKGSPQWLKPSNSVQLSRRHKCLLHPLSGIVVAAGSRQRSCAGLPLCRGLTPAGALVRKRVKSSARILMRDIAPTALGIVFVLTPGCGAARLHRGLTSRRACGARGVEQVSESSRGV